MSTYTRYQQRRTGQYVEFGCYDDQDGAIATWVEEYLPDGLASLHDDQDEGD